MKRVLFLIITIAMTLSARAQQDEVFYFEYDDESLDVSNLDQFMSYRHFMGEDIGKKLQLLRDSYTYRGEPTPTNPSPPTVIEKPYIYNNIKKLERYYKKAIKKGHMEEGKAIEEFGKIVDVALQIRYQRTDELETHLQEIKEEKEIVSVFSEKVQLSHY